MKRSGLNYGMVLFDMKVMEQVATPMLQVPTPLSYARLCYARLCYARLS